LRTNNSSTDIYWWYAHTCLDAKGQWRNDGCHCIDHSSIKICSFKAAVWWESVNMQETKSQDAQKSFVKYIGAILWFIFTRTLLYELVNEMFPFFGEAIETMIWKVGRGQQQPISTLTCNPAIKVRANSRVPQLVCVVQRL